MRNKFTIAFAWMLIVIPALNVFAQVPIQDFSWRNASSSSSQTVRSQAVLTKNSQAPVARTAKLPTVVTTRQAVPSDASPLPPQMKRRPFLVSFRKNQEQDQDSAGSVLDNQPSLSDNLSEGYDFDPPQAPASEGTFQEPASTVQVSPEPELNVQSNATDEPNYCDRDCKKDWCNLGCERKLFGKNCRGLELGGWFNVGYHNRPNILLNNRSREVALHQFWLFAENAASRDSCSWDIGYRADLIYGLDGPDLQAFGNAPTGTPSGWDNSWDFGSYGWALPQLYAQFANADWDIKVGKFFSPFGYEVVGATDNFFYSHSYTMYNSEPFTMTGILAEKQVASNRSVIMGLTAGWDTGFENNSGGSLILGTRYQPNDFVDLAITSSLGDSGARGTGRLTSAVAQLQLTESVSYVLQGDVLGLEDNNEFGIVQYLFRDVTPCLALGARLEWWKSNQFTPTTRSTYDFTMGANYRVNSNVTLRPELRFDWGAAAIDPGTPIIGIDAVVTF